MRGFFLVLGYLIGGGLSCGFAQPSYYANPFIEQIEHYPQEKLHVSTDKDSYIAGDTIWLRAHCADAATHRPVAAQCARSQIVSPAMYESLSVDT